MQNATNLKFKKEMDVKVGESEISTIVMEQHFLYSMEVRSPDNATRFCRDC